MRVCVCVRAIVYECRELAPRDKLIAFVPILIYVCPMMCQMISINLMMMMMMMTRYCIEIGR